MDSLRKPTLALELILNFCLGLYADTTCIDRFRRTRALWVFVGSCLDPQQFLQLITPGLELVPLRLVLIRPTLMLRV